MPYMRKLFLYWNDNNGRFKIVRIEIIFKFYTKCSINFIVPFSFGISHNKSFYVNSSNLKPLLEEQLPVDGKRSKSITSFYSTNDDDNLSWEALSQKSFSMRIWVFISLFILLTFVSNKTFVWNPKPQKLHLN